MVGDSNVGPTIAVKDVEAAKKFYGDVLGLELKDETPGGVSYKSGESGVFIYPSQYAGTNKATYAGWAVRDLESVVEALKAKGVVFEQYDGLPETERQGDIHVMGEFKMAWFKDPDGNILAIDNSAK